MIHGDFLTARVHLFRALGDPTRLQVLELLHSTGPLTVTELCQRFRKEQNLVSHHLTCLKNCGLVTAKRDGRHVRYALRTKTIQTLLRLTDTHLRTVLEDILACAVVDGVGRQRPSMKRP